MRTASARCAQSRGSPAAIPRHRDAAPGTPLPSPAAKARADPRAANRSSWPPQQRRPAQAATKTDDMEKEKPRQGDLAGRSEQHMQRRALDEQAGANDARSDRGRKGDQAERERQDRAAEGEPADRTDRRRSD